MQLLYYLRDMVQLLLSPLKGWEDVETDSFEAKTLLLRGLLPFLAITALTVFVKAFYVADIHWIALIEQAIVCFMKFYRYACSDQYISESAADRYRHSVRAAGVCALCDVARAEVYADQLHGRVEIPAARYFCSNRTAISASISV